MNQRRLGVLTIALSTLIGTALFGANARAQTTCPLTTLTGDQVLAKRAIPIAVPLRILESAGECLQIEITNAQWVTPGNALINEAADSGVLSDIVQLSNDGQGNAFITGVSDQDDGGTPDLSVLPNDAAPTLETRFEGRTGGGALLWQQLTISTTIDGGPVNVTIPVTVLMNSDGEQADGGGFDSLQFVPAAPPVAVWALALILMGGGVYMVRRQRIHRG